MAYVSCARFAGMDKVDFIDRLDIGRIIDAVHGVPAFIRRNTRMSAVIEDIKRKDIPEYPKVALREGLLNALMHGDYAYMNMRHFVSIFDDRLEIRSPGSLPPGMTIDGIKDGVSIPRNLVIARIFQVLGWVEQFGTGYLRIVKACEKHDYPLPEWREVGPYLDIIFKPLGVEGMHAMGVSGDQVGIKWGSSQDQVITELILVKDERKILKACQKQKSLSELMSLMKWKSRIKFTKRFISPLIEHGLLSMTIPDKPNSRLQKYIITDLGKMALEKLKR